MIRWEYWRYDNVENLDAVDKLGAAGWEAVGFSPHGWLLLKRPLGEAAPQLPRRRPLQLSARSVTRVDPASQAAGGYARAASLSPARRSELARAAANARRAKADP